MLKGFFLDSCSHYLIIIKFKRRLKDVKLIDIFSYVHSELKMPAKRFCKNKQPWQILSQNTPSAKMENSAKSFI